jgi:hypothetical protein
MLPALPATVSGNVPTVTVDWVVIVNIVLTEGVKGFAPKSALAPTGKPDTLIVTGEVNPFVAVSCVVKVMDCPCVMFRKDGAVDIWKSGVGAVAMDSVTAFVRVIVPALPVIVSGNVPTVMDAGVVMVMSALAVGTIGFVLNVAFAPLGNPEMLNVTGEVNPFVAVSCVVKVMDCPCVMLREDGAVDI